MALRSKPIRTIGELITELQQWPSDGLVHVGIDSQGKIGCGAPVSIRSVDGFAGGAIDGRDSGVTLGIREVPDWNGKIPTRRR